MPVHEKLRSFKIQDFNKCQSNYERAKFILRFAILAPSTHNSQPWLFKISNNSIQLYFDESARLPQSDPSNRNQFISLGAALANLLVATKYFGLFRDLSFNVEVKDNAATKIATIGINNTPLAGTARNKHYYGLLRAIQTRANMRGEFENRPITREVMNNIYAVSHDNDVDLDLITNKKKISRLADLSYVGVKEAHDKKKFRKEMSHWINSAASKKRSGIPAKALGTKGLISLVIPQLIKYFNLGSKLASVTRQSIKTAPVVGIVSSKDDTPTQWVKVGKLSQEIILELMKYDIKTSIFVAAIENAKTRILVRKLIGTSKLPHFLFCAGYMEKESWPTPRLLVREKLINKNA